MFRKKTNSNGYHSSGNFNRFSTGKHLFGLRLHMHQLVHLWLLLLESSDVVYRSGLPLFRLKFSMRYDVLVSWHLGRRKAYRCRWVSDMWATKAHLNRSYFRKLGASLIRRQLSTGESAPNFSLSMSPDLTYYQQTISIIFCTSLFPLFSGFTYLSRLSTFYHCNGKHVLFMLVTYPLKTQSTTTANTNHKRNTNKTQNQWLNGWKC